MPKRIKPNNIDPEVERIQCVEAARTAFKSADDWKRSKRSGNLWRHWNGLTLTVFKRDGASLYRWSIANNDTPRYSKNTYATEDEAMGSLWSEVEGQYM